MFLFLARLLVFYAMIGVELTTAFVLVLLLPFASHCLVSFDDPPPVWRRTEDNAVQGIEPMVEASWS